MIELVDLDSMIDKKLISKVALRPYNENGTVPLFGEFTHKLAEEYYKFICRLYPKDRRYNPAFYSRIKSDRDECYKTVEYLAKIGALATKLQSNGGLVFDFGCGIAIPSIAYSKLCDSSIIAVDKNNTEIDKAQKLAKELDTNLDFVVDKAENVISKRGLQPNDVVIISRPDGSLGHYWKELLKNYEFTLLLTRFVHSDEFPDQIELQLEDIKNKHFKQYGYGIKVGRTFKDMLLVFVASKN